MCPHESCRREHPIIDGIPVIVADIRSYMTHQLGSVRARSDLSPFTESLLGDCAGPESELDRTRYQLSSYSRSHYGDLDPDEPAPAASSLAALLETALEQLSEEPAGIWLDTGCSVGRASFEMARRTGDLVLGVDLNFAMLRIAHHVARTGRVAHPLRRLGIVYDERSFPVPFEDRQRVDFWACDATALPFADNAFDGVFSLNVLDCIASPLDHLIEVGRVLRSGARAVLTTPYDWSVNATPIQAWIGGHSQRSDNRGSGVREIHRLLSDEVPAEVASGLRIDAEIERVPWVVYVHERASMTYQVHVVIARATERPSAGPST